MSETPHTPDPESALPSEYLPADNALSLTPESAIEGSQYAAARAWVEETLRDPAASEAEMQEAVQQYRNVVEAKRLATDAVPLGEAIARIINMDMHEIHREPGAERLRAMHTADTLVQHYRAIRADLLAAKQRGEEIDRALLEANGWQLVEALAKREQLTQQSEADQP